MSQYLIETISKESLEQMNKLVASLTEGIDKVSKMNSEFKNLKLPSEIANGFSAVTEETKKSNKVVSDAVKLQKKLENSEKARMQAMGSVARQIIKNREETKRLNKESRENAKLASQSTGAYQRLRIKLAQAEKEYLDLGSSQKASNAEMRKAQREVLKLRNLSDKLNTGIRRGYDDVGRYGKAWKGLNGIVRASIGAFGLYQGIQFARTVLEDIKAIDGMNKALLQVTETTETFSEAKLFLNDVAEESGVEIIGLTQSYTKFLAAAKSTNLTVFETQNIFRQVAKAGAALGLTTDDINGSFRALEQILSKGKVQAEEIRGQLGERLPGAFQILAKSMGLTTSELSKQLELGNVLSEEVLPKFAEELERAYSLDKIDKVRTLVAEQNRLSNSWTQFVEQVDSGSGVISTAFLNILSSLTFVVDAFSSLNMSYDEWSEKIQSDTASEGYKQTSQEIRDEAERTGKKLEEVAQSYVDGNKPYLEELEKIGQSLKDRREELKELTSDQGTAPGLLRQLKDEYSEIDEKIRQNAISQGIYNGIVNAATDILEKNNNEKANENEWLIKTILNKTDEYNREQLLIKSKKELLELLANLNRKRGESNTKNEKQISLIDRLIKGEKDLAKAIKERFDAGISEGQDDLVQGSILDGLELPKEELQRIENDLQGFIDRASQAITDSEIRDILIDQFSGLEQTLGIDGGTFLTIFDGIKDGFQTAGEAAQAFGNVANGAFAEITANSNARLENERRNLEIEKATALEFAGDSAAAREQIEERYDQRQKEIRQKQVKNERAQALFEIGISTAVGVIKALAMTPPNIPLSIAIGGIGLAQAAVVAARPIPQFYDGVENFDGGTAMINDGKGSNYKEIVRTPDGKMRKYSGRNLIMDLPKGTDVLSAKDSIAFENSLNAMLGANDINMLGDAVYGQGVNAPVIINQGSNGITREEMKQIMAQSISKQAKNVTVLDKDGLNTYVKNGHSKKVILDNRVTFKGISV